MKVRVGQCCQTEGIILPKRSLENQSRPQIQSESWFYPKQLMPLLHGLAGLSMNVRYETCKIRSLRRLSLEVLPPLMFPMTVTPLGRDQDCSLKNREPDVPASWFLDPGGWSKTAAVGLYFIFPGICTLSIIQ
ncbi:hypothetical protein STEG23_003209 [Scotinomys teguina]